MSRTPSEIQSTRIGPLSRLPAFFALDNKRAVVAGGGEPAAWKAELLSAAGARVEVFAAAPGEALIALAGAPPHGSIVIHERPWAAADLAGAAIAVADCADDQEAARFAAAARAAGVPVNVIDRPAFCDFSFGAIVNRSPLVIGISTDGAAPVFGQAIRAKIEALIPKGFSRWAEAARAWRPRVQKLALPFRARRSFWEKFTARAVGAPDRMPTEADLAALLTPAVTQGAGSVVLVGAGPGNPGIVDAARGARAAIGRRDFVRRSRCHRHSRFRAPRSQKNAGRQNWSRRLVPAGRHQRADDLARQIGPPRGAAQRRRPDDFRPGRRRDCGLPRRGDRGRSGARHHHGARCCEPSLGLADAPRRSAPRAIHHRSWPRRKIAGRYRLEQSRRSGGHDRHLHAGQDIARTRCSSDALPASIRQRPPSLSSARRAPTSG